MDALATDFDAIIVGGGPAGAVLATLLAQRGHHALIVEKETLPRYRIGESLLPATVRDLADMLGIRQALQHENFVQKRGATFSWGRDKENLWNLNFGGLASAEENIPSEIPSAFNVRRSRFDKVLLENAARHGVEIRQACRVTDFIQHAGRFCGVNYLDAAGKQHAVSARYIVDAGGQRSKLARSFGQRKLSRFFRKVSVWRYFESGKRLPAPLSGNVLFQTYGDTWLWYIPIDDDLTSVGMVMSADQYDGARIAAVQLGEMIAACPLISDYLACAKPVCGGEFGEVRTCSEYSYAHSEFWQPGALLLGDAACFVDVLLSSGVHLATFGAMLAAQSIDAVLTSRLSEAVAMNEFESRLRREYAIFYNGLVGLYDMTLSEEEYSGWLRNLLSETSGIAFDNDEISDLPEDLATLHRRSQTNVENMRQFVDTQLSFDQAGGMNLPSVPELLPTVSGSSDMRTWLPPVFHHGRP